MTTAKEWKKYYSSRPDLEVATLSEIPPDAADDLVVEEPLFWDDIGVNPPAPGVKLWRVEVRCSHVWADVQVTNELMNDEAWTGYGGKVETGMRDVVIRRVIAEHRRMGGSVGCGCGARLYLCLFGSHMTPKAAENLIARIKGEVSGVIEVQGHLLARDERPHYPTWLGKN